MDQIFLDKIFFIFIFFIKNSVRLGMTHNKLGIMSASTTDIMKVYCGDYLQKCFNVVNLGSQKPMRDIPRGKFLKLKCIKFRKLRFALAGANIQRRESLLPT